MGVEGGGKFDHVARFEPFFAKQFCRQFQTGDVPNNSIYAGNIHQPSGPFINNRLQPSSDAAANGVVGSVEKYDPFGAVTRAHDLVLVESVLAHILRVKPKI